MFVERDVEETLEEEIRWGWIGGRWVTKSLKTNNYDFSCRQKAVTSIAFWSVSGGLFQRMQVKFFFFFFFFFRGGGGIVPPSPTPLHSSRCPSLQSTALQGMNKRWWGRQNRTALKKCTHLYDDTQGTISHKRFRQRVFVGCKEIDRK